MDDPAHRQRFQRGAATADQIGAVAAEVMAELGVPGSEASRAVERAGIDPVALHATRVEVTEGEQGLEPVLTTILVSITTTVGSKVVESFWTDVLWPRIRRRLGADALGPRASDPRPSEEKS